MCFTRVIQDISHVATLVCAFCIHIVPQVDLYLSPIGVSGSLHGASCLKFTDVSGRIVDPIIRVQDKHVVWMNILVEICEKFVFRSGGHTNQMAGGRSFLMGGKADVKGKYVEYGRLVHFSCYSCLFPLSGSQKILFLSL
jgi:hypothetical protein